MGKALAACFSDSGVTAKVARELAAVEGGSDIGRTAECIQALVGDRACLDTGKRLGGTISEADLKTRTGGLKL